MAARKKASGKRTSRRAPKRRGVSAAPKRTASAQADTPLPDHLIRVTERRVVVPGGARGTVAVAAVSVDEHRHDVVEVNLEGGGRFYTRFDQFTEDFGGPRTRDGAPGAVFVVPATLAGPSTDRGVGTWAIKTLRFLGIDPIDSGAELSATAVCRWYEKKQLHRRAGDQDAEQRLWRVQDADTFDLEWIDAATPSAAPLLVLLHGTASSSQGSFGELWASASSDIRNRILAPYRQGGRLDVYAFEHFSLTQSPIDNALALLDALPDHARVHLVSHSRGGLVGELLCRGQMVGRDPFENDEIVSLFGGAAYAGEAQQLRRLNDALKRKKLRIERYVRVACPARGTILASERLDRWLSLTLDAVGGIADLATSGYYAIFEEFVKAFVRTRADPAALPGLEAQMPGSPLVRLLNRPDVRTAADLHVIAGDIEGGDLLRRLGILLTDLYYREDHDLVVNTRAMYGGTPRVDPPRRFFAQGPEVYHFTYFRNANTAAKVADALHKAPAQDGFEAFDPQDSARADRGYRAPPTATRDGAVGTRPIVFVLPGIMGSCLDVDGQRVWLDLPSIGRGAMDELAIDASGVTASALMPASYAAFTAFLDATHEVVPFPFDWRLSLRQEAKRLAAAITQWLDDADRRGQPLALVAHSLGGLLARVMIADFPDLWQRVVARPEGRLVMLGTPNGGSFSIPLMLLGRETIVQGLALVDFKHMQRDLIALIGRFPGVLELLPGASAQDFFAPATWTVLDRLDDNGRVFWTAPPDAALAAARGVRALLDRPTPRPDRQVYVAGRAPHTPWQLHLESPPGGPGGPEGSARAPENFYFEDTPEGDGRVPWSTGIPAGIRTWYMEAAHGNLAATPAHFVALRELIQSGVTDKLPATPPFVGRRDAAPQVFLPARVPYVPDAQALEAAAVGRSTELPPAAVEVRPIDVEVTNGDLAFSRYPVFVGHYQDDSIGSAEAQMDKRLAFRLSAHQQLGLYPGAAGTAEVFRNPDSPLQHFPGAVVIGLGKLGELTPASLTSSFAHGAVAYAVDCVERAADATAMTEVAISTLLIGTGWKAVPVRDSVVAILRGVVHANDELARSPYAKRIRIGAIQFIELFEDMAIQATHALRIANAEADLSGKINARLTMETLEGARRRAFFDDAGNWWQRLQVVEQEDEALKFTFLTDRARAETTLQPTQRKLVEMFIERQIATTANDEAICVTLFELLVPNQLKQHAPEGRDLLLVLDAAAAAFPWELMQDGSSGASSPNAPGVDPFQLRIALRAGLVRQLQTETFREAVINATGANALVVGDPQSDFPELVGAQQEAAAVATALQERRIEGRKLEVTHLQRPQGDAVVQELFRRPYRILHLAGHGVVDLQLPLTEAEQTRACAGEQVKPRRVTGMVLGGGVFLTPTEIGQMRQVPEVVFLNCCHLGRIGEEQPTLTGKRHLLAANVAEELIRIGVKVVVAAGWAVDDGAAALFAKVFYEQLLSGTSFGQTVLMARRATARAFPQVNTWGAYQCYGDPDFRLKTGDEIRGSSYDRPLAAGSELVVLLDNLASQALSASSDEVRTLGAQLDALRKVLDQGDPAWAADARIRASFGLALGELDRFDDAIVFLRKAVATDPAVLSVKAVEQYAELLSRAAATRWTARAGDADQAREAVLAQVEEAIQLLEALLKVGETTERLSLLGAAHKRRALIVATAAQRAGELDAMCKYYRAAHELAVRQTGAIDAYPLLSWLAGEACRRPDGVEPGVRATANDVLARVRSELRTSARTDFDARVTGPELSLVTALLAGTIDAKALDDALQSYRAIVAAEGSPRQLRWVVEHLQFLAAIYRESASARARRLATQLQAAVDALLPPVVDEAASPDAGVPTGSATRRAKRAVKAGAKRRPKRGIKRTAKTPTRRRKPRRKSNNT